MGSTTVLAFLMLVLSPSIGLEHRVDAAPRSTLAAASRPTDLKAVLLERLATIDAQKHGVFHEDVTDIVVPMFPVGQPFDETKRVVEGQHLGALERFKGEPHDGTSMYVARSPLAPEAPGNVYVVIDIDFDGRTEADMRLKSVKAYLRASNM